MHTKKEIDVKLNELAIKPLKSLGQNFLVNPKICQKIIDEVQKSNPRFICEIGPGLGALTEGLQAIGNKLLLIELDKTLAHFWKEKGFEVLHQDALKTDWEKLNLKDASVLVSNLPYSIAASLVVELSGLENTFSKMILMFQKEVAERIQAKAGTEDYGFPSVVAQTYWNIERLIDAGPQDFHPVPHVGSRVLVFSHKSGIGSKAAFTQFVKQAFSQRRKLLSKNLSSKVEPNKLAQAYEELKIDPKVRAQDLDPSLFERLFKICCL